MRGLFIRDIAYHLGLHSLSVCPVLGFQIDSRSVGPGDLFFAIKGAKNDGHDFLRDVREKGAVGAVVSSSYKGPDYGLVLLFVEDVFLSLTHLAKVSMIGSSSRIVAITGSVGKTTTKDFTATLLEARYRVGKTPLNQNSKLTCPLTVLNRKGDEEILVLEMGMGEMGDIGRLVSIAPPDVAVLTKVALAHSESFPGGLPDIAKGKAEIFSHPKTKLAIFDQGFYSYTQEVAKIGCEKRSFSVEESKDLSLCPFQEPHIIHNFLAALEVCRYFNLSREEIERQIPLLQLPKMRLERFEKNGIYFINDAYNANPESMRAALLSLSFVPTRGRKIGVLGSMASLGQFSLEEHQKIGRYASQFLDDLLVLGQEAYPLYEAFLESKKKALFFSDHKDIAFGLKQIAQEGDLVLLKGSRCMNMETILDYI